MKSEIETLLTQNNLYLKKIPPGPNSLMRAISDALYFTPNYYSQISQMVVQFLKKLISQNQVPKTISILKTNYALQQDYTNRPYFAGFDKINLELVSMMFRIKVNIYFVSADQRLSVKIINQNYERMIELFSHENHYDCVYSQQFIKKSTQVQSIIYEIFQQTFKTNTSIPKVFRNNQMEIWMDERLASQNSQKRGRALSDDQFVPESEQQIEYTNEFDLNTFQVQKITNELQELQMSEDTQQEQILNLKGNPPGITISKSQQNTQQLQEQNNKKPIIIEESQDRFTGRLKFFDEGKNYGFLVLDNDNSDIFVHQDDLQKAGISKDFLRGLGAYYRPNTQVNHYGKGNQKAPRFSFIMMTYVGKYNKSRKAIELKLLAE